MSGDELVRVLQDQWSNSPLYSQGTAWIMKRSKPHIIVTHTEDKNFLNQLEDSLTNGKSVLLETVDEEMDPVLDPLLEKQIAKMGRSYKINIAEKELDYSENFRVRIIQHNTCCNSHVLTFFSSSTLLPSSPTPTLLQNFMQNLLS